MEMKTVDERNFSIEMIDELVKKLEKNKNVNKVGNKEDEAQEAGKVTKEPRVHLLSGAHGHTERERERGSERETV